MLNGLVDTINTGDGSVALRKLAENEILNISRPKRDTPAVVVYCYDSTVILSIGTCPVLGGCLFREEGCQRRQRMKSTLNHCLRVL